MVLKLEYSTRAEYARSHKGYAVRSLNISDIHLNFSTPEPAFTACVIPTNDGMIEVTSATYGFQSCGGATLDSTGNLDAWCCGHAPASGRAPAYSWDILHFF